ncbi:MAG: outer membrane protein assembly factor BamE [Thiohalorhabdus sp.]|uniref:outer membrane protein assembly factor BamE n=1 Tax=Thiohalorhabdus sp. TaxID=3094134 RepID=UPI003980D20E
MPNTDPAQSPRLLPALGLAVLLLALGGCARMEVEQGNYLTKTQVEGVERGMSQAAVRRSLGEPLLRDPFRPDRWDYAFLLTSEAGERTYRRLTVFFDEQGQVKRLERAGEDFPER